MKKVSVTKRVFAVMMAILMVFSCILTAYAGQTVAFSGDSGSGKGEIKLTSGGCKMQYKIGTRSGSTSSQHIASYAIGTKGTVTAVDTASRQFKYWVDDYTGRVYTYDRTVEFIVGSRIALRTVCARASDTDHFVSYVNYGGTTMLGTYMFANNTQIEVPDDTKVPGFTFRGWSMSESEVNSTTEDVIVYPTYTVNAETYTVTITNDAYVSGAGTYSNFQTVNLKAEPVNGAGEAFSYWMDSNNTIISFDRNYSFRINYNVTLTAVYGADATPIPVIRISKVFRDPSDLKITFYAERSVPEEYTVVSHGILLTQNESATEAQLNVGAAGETASASIRKAYGNSNENCGTFSLAKAKISRVTTIAARPFVICQDANGVQTVVYGDMVKTTNAG